MTQDFDVIVIGGGHAGCEAAAAAARRGCQTLLIAIAADGIGAMSCNPAIGGIGKGHIVREIDVFDGLIAAAADDAAIHYRMLNRSKGVAVHGPRIQADRQLYGNSIRARLARQESLAILSGEVIEIEVQGSRVVGVRMTDGEVIRCRSIVLATGTFLGGRLFRGEERLDGGRLGEAGAHRLAAQLGDLGFKIGRLKTGTPPRLDARTIDWSILDRQPSDAERWTMSPASARRRDRSALFCGITRTTIAAHDVIRDASDRSPLYSGAIEGRGPRYCPSIEDKVVRFGDRDGHQIFLEPETLGGHLIYPNGLSTSLPSDIQQRMIARIPGLARAEIVVPGYAVEYGHIDPRILTPDLAARGFGGLFFAGQINGTTGYEEAAGQGLVAGLNAAAHALETAPMTFARHLSYIGVMIDDLTLHGVSEPYRMLTARAEFRLSLRADNAETRLADLALASGCLSTERQERLTARRSRKAMLEASSEPRIESADDHVILDEIASDRYYAPYVARQEQDLSRTSRLNMPVPVGLSYRAIKGLSAEMVERLEAARPATVAQASRLPGVTPAAVSALIVAARRAEA